MFKLIAIIALTIATILTGTPASAPAMWEAHTVTSTTDGAVIMAGSQECVDYVQYENIRLTPSQCFTDAEAMEAISAHMGW